MSFDTADYRRAAMRLEVPVAHIMAMAAVESAGETFWTVNGKTVPPVRFESHWFGRLTGYRFNASHPDLSCVDWTPELAARTRAGAWDQLERARQLDRAAADQATSWGTFQVLAYHWKRLGYPSVQAFVDSMSDRGDDGQMDAFVRFVDIDEALQQALRTGDWDTVEVRYNGGGYGGAYADKLRTAAAVYGGHEAPAVPRALRRGDHGADVVLLQAALGIKPDSEFGPRTEQAVRMFQADRGLVIDGIVGAMTRAALNI